MARFIFITGGVVSSLGKGLMAASLAALLQARGYKVRLRKLDPYLNVDPGTMSPYQHGEVYVTDDGAETDLDLGHYERYTGVAPLGHDRVAYLHLTLVPYLASAGELKTKPTQHSVRELRAIGIQPDLLLCRAERPIPPDARRKIALQCSVQPDSVIPALDVTSIYEVPIRYHEEGLDTQLLKHFGMPYETEPDLRRWHEIVKRLRA